MRHSRHMLVVRTLGALALALLPAACSDLLTAPPPLASPPSVTTGSLAPDAALRAVFPETTPQVYPAAVAILVHQTPVGTIPAVVASSGADRGIAFFRSASPALSVLGGGLISYVGGIARGEGGIVVTIGQASPNSAPFTFSIDFSQFDAIPGNPVVLVAGGISGGGCIFATAVGGDGVRFTVRLDFVPRQH